MRTLEGRKLWLVGIGGVGMSGLALVARARGATVGGSDRAASATTERLAQCGIDVVIGHSADNVPRGFEVVASSAIAADNPELAGRVVRHRADLLAELLDSDRSIVVAGAHGKTTTASMIAFCLDRMGEDPTFLIGGNVPQLDTNARSGGGWTVAEGDESDGSLLKLAPAIAVITNVDHDHHAEFASRAEVEALFERWLAGAAAGARVVRGEEVALEESVVLSVPGEHNRSNAACALSALVLAGFDRARVEAALVEFTGVERRLEPHGAAGGVSLRDDYAHHPAEVEAALCAARGLLGARGRLLVLFQPHLFSRTAYLAPELAAALAHADAVCLTGIYAAREEPLAGVSAKLISDALGAVRPGMRIGLAHELDDAATLVGSWAREGDLVLTMGAGDVNRAIGLLKAQLG